jgi:zinc/manganese transport system substrate-binding protein
VLLAPLVAGCGSQPLDAAGSGQPVIMATTSIWADVVSHVACNGLARVETVIAPGGDPHSAEPSLADRARMERAAVVVANGLGLEEGLGHTIDAVEAHGTPVFRVGDHLPTMERDGRADPHIWFDPTRVSSALPDLAEVLVARAGLDRQAVTACLAGYRQELADLDAEMTGVLGAVPPDRRKLVTNHDALGYFADRYHFEVIGTVIPSTSSLAASSPAQLDRLGRAIQDAGVPAIFAEAKQSETEADALARRIGPVGVVVLYSDSLEPGTPADSYVGLLRADAQLVAAALT